MFLLYLCFITKHSFFFSLSECRCNLNGSLSSICDKKTGQCRCKPNVLGKFCDHCTPGFYSLAASCLPCSCDETGSKSAICDDQTGRCKCKPGVAGLQCDKCAEDHYGFSHHGCKSEFYCNNFNVDAW